MTTQVEGTISQVSGIFLSVVLPIGVSTWENNGR
jgi:hypothetical protein